MCFDWRIRIPEIIGAVGPPPPLPLSPGFNRVIVEKPFGTDLDTYKALSKELAGSPPVASHSPHTHTHTQKSRFTLVAPQFPSKPSVLIWNITPQLFPYFS